MMRSTSSGPETAESQQSPRQVKQQQIRSPVCLPGASTFGNGCTW